MNKKIFEQLNISSECRKYGLPLWQCPHFIFVLMGIINIISCFSTYIIGSSYVEDPLIITLIVILITGFLFILSFIVTQSFENLAEASRMKLEFLTILSHEMRAPFSNLRWVVELLTSGKAGEMEKRHKEYLYILKENSERMEQLINKLITVTKIEQRKVPLKREYFSLKDLIEKTILEFKANAESSSVKIEFEAQSDLPEIFADSSQIREVLENLLDNAIKYSKENGVVLIKLFKKHKNIWCEVKDDGAGIPEGDKKYIFQKFFRAGNMLKRQTKGSGLGLFIVKSIINLHKGKIGFTSEEGKGTTFWFFLPLIKDK